jgi:Family of unknown function (DUF6516)
MAEHPFVLTNELTWQRRKNTASPPRIVSITLSGRVVCAHDVVVTVYKTLITRNVRDDVLEVQGYRYSYNASLTGRHNILRYDNGHADPEEFHRHEYNLETGLERVRTIVTRPDVPSLAEFFTEVAGIVGFPLE